MASEFGAGICRRLITCFRRGRGAVRIASARACAVHAAVIAARMAAILAAAAGSPRSRRNCSSNSRRWISLRARGLSSGPSSWFTLVIAGLSVSPFLALVICRAPAVLTHSAGHLCVRFGTDGKPLGCYAERARDLAHGTRVDAARVGFQAQDGVSTDAGLVGQLLLGEGMGPTQVTHTPADWINDVSHTCSICCVYVARPLYCARDTKKSRPALQPPTCS